ncbi:MAG: tetratricopeptide repeat protein [Asgard group archaeon]|nr:tetratricopeptide repeat protein [Asgard group archaeon]
MKDVLPPEILSSFHSLEKSEREAILNYKAFNPNTNLAEIETVLSKIAKEETSFSNSFGFLYGRILYHRGHFDEINNLYEKTNNDGLGLWYLMYLIFKGDYEKYNENIDNLKRMLKDSILSAFIYYVEAISGFLTQKYSKYLENRENCFNFIALNTQDEKGMRGDIFKLIQIYMLEMDALYLRSNYVLSLARNKTKECLNINRALNDRIIFAQIYSTIGTIELDRGNFQLAHQIFLKSEAIAREIKMDRLLGHITGSIGDVYLQMGHLDEAMFWYNKSKSIVEKWKSDYRSLYVLHSNFADVYYAKEDFDKATEEMEIVLEILQKKGFQDLSMNMKYAEILLYQEAIGKVEEILLMIDREWKDDLTPTQQAYYWFLLGFLEYKSNNFGISQEYLQNAMVQADELGNEILSSKTLVLISMVFLKKYTISLNLEELIEADKCLEDIVTYLEEKAKYESLSIIYHIRAKIKIMLLDFETALFLLKRGEDYARTYTPLLMDDYRARIEQVKQAIESEIEQIVGARMVSFIEDIGTISTILRKESKKLAAPKEEKPMAILIFHSSGIPISTYLSEDVSVSDDLLFGGFVSAIRHLMNELFVDQKQGVLSIDHGQYKLLIEFYSNLFSVVVIALRDSFMLRRKMHRLVEHLSVKGILEDQYKGDMSETESYELDSVIANLFGIRSYRSS